MCVAIYKPKGAKTPNLATLKQCWDANPDGAGIAMRRDRGKFCIEIHKGFMTFEEFTAAFNDYALADCEDELFLHFRITTHGGTEPGNCHPFPLTKNITLLKHEDLLVNAALMHNGVLPLSPDVKDISDTMELCRLIAGGLTDKLPQIVELLSPFIGSNKLAAMTPDGVYLAGEWHDIDGVKFSNLNWQYFGSMWGDGYGDDCWQPSKKELKLLKKGVCPHCDSKGIVSDVYTYYCEQCGAMWEQC